VDQCPLLLRLAQHWREGSLRAFLPPLPEALFFGAVIAPSVFKVLPTRDLAGAVQSPILSKLCLIAEASFVVLFATSWWITRREADHAPGYGGPPVLPDIRVCWEWHVEERCWIKGSLRDRQNREIPHNVVIHANNGWRIEGPGEGLVP
jgi:hypothetical protein